MPYLLDANIFIQAKNLHYGLDFCPAFWDWLIAANRVGIVFSIEKVGDEIDAGVDELAVWAAQRGPTFFLKPDAKLLPALGTVSNWASSQNYEPAAVSMFLQVADYYLIAHALAHGHTVVTHARGRCGDSEEGQDPQRVRRVGNQVHVALRDVAPRAG